MVVAIDELLTKKQLEVLIEQAKEFQYQSLGFIKFENSNWTGSLASQLSDQEKEQLIKRFNIKSKATILINFGKYEKFLN
ncbi:hypothetical protein MmmBen181_0494 [Mycoplasma mycoides subsp. mycoides]|uniref:GAD domain protein n=1 Tax=Mycoplasma mycoides subsp. mycoides TaxID=2103 RepID=A0AAE2EJ44_MYCMY|nr:GAD domain-containing protein [Mycoplasma mycoides]ADK69654.1 conserved domain protein [Mycoplasma mycoides subsp. mycoides SC str. Gladysdale]AIZ55296.1 GAD domain protein [Mycoplasma mycoides subsp. mycoides]AME10643.1 hypothetical protein MmmBen_0473 [Mycoplasma mycoides subsp. mycoides]AME11653.1 hypothetical protein MmmBen50_0467 [Mycoplasma mycoides subsp. mycoides]AME12677.1 hypothetical protein MmmBen181_0494 [Mycoplasma mycoides subsp. mycoides]